MSMLKSKFIKTAGQDKEGVFAEVITVNMEYRLGHGESWEDMMLTMQRHMDSRLNALFQGESTRWNERMLEVERWRQMGLFDYPGFNIQQLTTPPEQELDDDGNPIPFSYGDTGQVDGDGNPVAPAPFDPRSIPEEFLEQTEDGVWYDNRVGPPPAPAESDEEPESEDDGDEPAADTGE